jgi:hypothetical protein
MFAGVDQKHASAGGDVVAGSKTENHTYNNIAAVTAIEKLMAKLASEMREDVKVRAQIDELQHYYRQRASDGVVGLEAKLKAAGRSDELLDAYEKKELFVKLLNRFSLYASAQEIFAFMLARGESRFKTYVTPAVQNGQVGLIDQLTIERIVEPLVAELGGGAFPVTDALIMGMIYWLAEQCFVRWHS